MKKLLLVAILLLLTGCLSEPNDGVELQKARAELYSVMFDDMYVVAKGYRETMKGMQDDLAQAKRENIELQKKLDEAKHLFLTQTQNLRHCLKESK